LHRLCQQQFVLQGKRKELLTAKVRKGVAKIAKKTLLVVVKRSEVEIFALIGVLLCILKRLKSVATPLAAVPSTHLLIWRSTLFPWLAS
jgi:hypothetical protein